MVPSGLIVITEERLASLWEMSRYKAVRALANMIDRGLFKAVVCCGADGNYEAIPKETIQVMLSPPINCTVAYWDDLQRIAWLRDQWAIAAMIGFKEWMKIRGDKQYRQIRQNPN